MIILRFTDSVGLKIVNRYCKKEVMKLTVKLIDGSFINESHSRSLISLYQLFIYMHDNLIKEQN